MKYVGSKNRHAKAILNVIKPKETDTWVEPFVGGANMIDKVPCKIRIGADVHPQLIKLLTAIRDGWIPPQCVPEEIYRYEMKEKQNTAMCGFVGFCCSYSGKWFGGYARGNTNKGEPRNYAMEAHKNLLKQAPKLRGVELYWCPYSELEIPPKSIIYCDPPYKDTTKYSVNNFDHQMFWNWCEEKVKKGHRVYVSEYNAPDGWVCVWQKEVSNTLVKNTGSKKGVEKLFTRVIPN